MLECGNYSPDFICNLQKQISKKIAFVSIRDYKDTVYGLGINSNLDKYEDLVDLYGILEGILACSPCYQSENIEEIVSLVKRKINQC